MSFPVLGSFLVPFSITYNFHLWCLRSGSSFLIASLSVKDTQRVEVKDISRPWELGS